MPSGLSENDNHEEIEDDETESDEIETNNYASEDYNSSSVSYVSDQCPDCNHNKDENLVNTKSFKYKRL